MRALLYGVRPDDDGDPDATSDNPLLRGLAQVPMALVDLDDPRPLRPDWVVTRPRLTGICGSDAKQVFGDWGDVRTKLDNVLGSALELGEEGAVTMVGHGIGGNPGIINKARATAFGAGVPLNAVSVSPLRVTLWCDRQHVDNLVRAMHKAFIE